MGHGNLFLAGDIGGTKTTLAMMEADAAGALAIRRTETFTSASESSLESIIAKFLSRGRETGIQGACFGVAGAIIDGRCKTTNLPWPEMSEAGLAKAAGVPRVKLLNDLEAMAYGMLFLAPSDFVELNPSVKPGPARGHAAVIAAGTGLGEAILYWDGMNYHPIATEGGHSDFAPNDELEDGLLAYLRQTVGRHVSYERILSGTGIALVYRYLRDIDHLPESPALAEALSATDDPAREISRHAQEHNDPLARETLRRFARIYGAEAGNLALKCLARGGVLIGGGIAPKILNALVEDRQFMEGFRAKGRFAEFLRQVPVRVALNPNTALLGAADYAARCLL